MPSMRRPGGSGVATGATAMVYSTNVLLFTGSVTVLVNLAISARYGTVRVTRCSEPEPVIRPEIEVDNLAA